MKKVRLAVLAFLAAVCTLDETQIAAAVNQVGSTTTLQVIMVLQSTFYALIFGVFGLILSNKAGRRLRQAPDILAGRLYF